MNKDTLELERVKDTFVYNGFYPLDKWNETQVLDKLVEWSKIDRWTDYDNGGEGYGAKITNKGKKVYKHVLRKEKENLSKDRYVQPPGGHKEPICDLVYYLDIYWQ